MNATTTNYIGLKFFDAQMKQNQVTEYSERHKGYLVSEEGMPEGYRAIMQAEQIELYLSNQEKWIESDKRYRELERQEQVKKDLEAFNLNNTYGYAESIKLTPMAKGKLLKTLNTKFNYYENGIYKINMARKDFIKLALEQGATLEHKTNLNYYDKKGNLKIKANEYRICSPDNSFYVITKTEYEYGMYLKELQDISE